MQPNSFMDYELLNITSLISVLSSTILCIPRRTFYNFTFDSKTNTKYRLSSLWPRGFKPIVICLRNFQELRSSPFKIGEKKIKTAIRKSKRNILEITKKRFWWPRLERTIEKRPLDRSRQVSSVWLKKKDF